MYYEALNKLKKISARLCLQHFGKFYFKKKNFQGLFFKLKVVNVSRLAQQVLRAAVLHE